MLKGNESLVDSILFAFGLEKGSHTFYLKAAEKMEDPRSKEFFNSMADLEFGHMANIRLLYCGMEDEACPARLDDFVESVTSLYMEGGRLVEDALKELDVAFLDESTALKIAIKQEGEAYGFYSKAAKRMEDPHARVLFKNLAAEEQKHLDALTKKHKAMQGE